MCLTSTPSIPDPVKPQDAKMAEQTAQTPGGQVSDARKNAAQNGGAAGGTMLTGVSGVENSSLSLGRSTLLGS